MHVGMEEVIGDAVGVSWGSVVIAWGMCNRSITVDSVWLPPALSRKTWSPLSAGKLPLTSAMLSLEAIVIVNKNESTSLKRQV